MSESPLYRAAGPVALAAGTFFVVTDLGRYPLHDNRLALATDPLLIAVNAAYFFAFVGLMIALIAVHGRLAPSLGRFGMVAFLVAVLGVMTQGGNMWFDGFAVPWLAQALPQVFSTPPTLSLQIGGLLSYVLFALGWVLYGLVALRARALPVALSLALVVGGLLGYSSGLPPYGTPIGLAVAAVGVWLIRRDRAAARARTLNSPCPNAELARVGASCASQHGELRVSTRRVARLDTASCASRHDAPGRVRGSGRG